MSDIPALVARLRNDAVQVSEHVVDEFGVRMVFSDNLLTEAADALERLEKERDEALAAYDKLLTTWAESRERHLAAEKRCKALTEFAREVIRRGWESGGIEGDEIQDMAEAAGLIEEVAFDPEKHRDPEGYMEAGDPWYMFTAALAEGEQ